MRAAGLAREIVQRSWFAEVFNKAPELKDITISALKRNFGRCCVRIPRQQCRSSLLKRVCARQVCVKLQADVERALKSHCAVSLAEAKEARVKHLALARSDRVAYYCEKEKARSPMGDKLTLIIDKMDSAKNQCPTFTTRFPKDVCMCLGGRARGFEPAPFDSPRHPLLSDRLLLG